MSRRSITAFSLVTAIMIAAAWYATVEQAPQTEVESPYFLPALQSRVNDVARIEITSGAARTVIEKRGAGWVVANRGGFAADFEKVKRAVVSIADLRRLEPKTANRVMYARIGVEDVDAKGSTSRQVSFFDPKGTAIAAIVLGNTRGNKPRPGLEGQPFIAALYAREAGTAQSWLVAGDVSVSARPSDWMDRFVADISGQRVSEVRIEAPGKTTVVLKRASREATDLELQDIPADSVPRSQAVLNSLGTALAELRFDDVDAAPATEFPVQSTTIATLRTFDGLVATVHLVTTPGAATRARFEFAYDAAGATADAPAAAATPASDDAEAQKPKRKPVGEEAQELAQRVRGWVYTLPEFKVSMLTRRFEDLIAKRDAQPAPQSPPAPAQTPAE